MKCPYTIDLHMHTSVSDGTDAPDEIIGRVKAAGITLFSVTDHDAVKCSRIIPPLLKEGDPRFLPGVEFSCRDELGQYHILGYGYDPLAPSVQQVVDLGHSYRMYKVTGRLDALKKEFGFVFDQDDLNRLLALDNPGKPHIGNMMVRYGYAKTKEEAITEYINKMHFRGRYVSPGEAIEGILNGGGIPVLAHPCYGSGDQLILGDEMDARLRRLIDFGLQGMECFYSGFTAKLRAEMLSFARRYDLYITAGSDYHGTNKMVMLGDTGMHGDTEIPDGMARFLTVIEDRLQG